MNEGISLEVLSVRHERRLNCLVFIKIATLCIDSDLASKNDLLT